MTPQSVTWHADRRVRLLAEHPEVKRLMGPDPWTQPIIAAVVAGQFAVAAALHQAPWWLVGVAGYLVGAVFAHALGVLIHEATHGLVARGRLANQLWLLACNLPLILPAAVGFRHDHLLHHQFLGEVDGRDTQSPVAEERRFANGSAWRKFASFTFGRFFYPGNPHSKIPFAGWLAVNLGVQVLVTGLFTWAFGWHSLAYLAISPIAAFGPHPLGARRLSEHLAAVPGQPTNSYYGPWNRVSFNVGYHVEHHDFPGVAWRRLPALRRLARRDYDRLFWIRSWTFLLLEYFLRSSHRVDHYAGIGRSIAEERRGPVSHYYGSDCDLCRHHDDHFTHLAA